LSLGLCIEANPKYWRDLSFRKCQVVGAVVGHIRMEKVKFLMKGVSGGLVGNDFDNKVKGKSRNNMKGETLEFYTVPLLEILQRNHAPAVIDYLSLDVEGAEYFIMQDFPFDQYTVRVLTVERPKAELRSLLRSQDYHHIKDMSKWGETLWVHATYASALNYSIFPGYIFDPLNVTVLPHTNTLTT
jgi:hypothetical protein